MQIKHHLHYVNTERTQQEGLGIIESLYHDLQFLANNYNFSEIKVEFSEIPPKDSQCPTIADKFPKLPSGKRLIDDSYILWMQRACEYLESVSHKPIPMELYEIFRTRFMLASYRNQYYHGAHEFYDPSQATEMTYVDINNALWKHHVLYRIDEMYTQFEDNKDPSKIKYPEFTGYTIHKYEPVRKRFMNPPISIREKIFRRR